MHRKHVTTFPITEFRLLVLVCIVFICALLPNDANAATDILNTIGATGFTDKLGDLAIKKIAEEDTSLHAQSNALQQRRSSATARGVSGTGGQLTISNGQDAYPKEYAHQAALAFNTSEGLFQICGAVIISEYHALTAAHCLPYLTGEKNKTFDHFIIVGMLDLSIGLKSPEIQMVRVVDFLIHKGYGGDLPGYPNDIAVLYLDGPVVNNSYVQFAEIAHPSMGQFFQKTCLFSGWGIKEETGDASNILQWGYQYIPTTRDCKDFWAVSRTARITKRHICGYFYPIQICAGDSGGALMCNGVVAGIASWSLGNCSGCFPSIYTRVSIYYWWIRKAMGL